MKIDKKIVEKINTMEHYEMWRNAPCGHKYFDNTLPYHKIYRKRLFEHFGGFTPKISKQIG